MEAVASPAEAELSALLGDIPAHQLDWARVFLGDEDDLTSRAVCQALDGLGADALNSPRISPEMDALLAGDSSSLLAAGEEEQQQAARGPWPAASPATSESNNRLRGSSAGGRAEPSPSAEGPAVPGTQGGSAMHSRPSAPPPQAEDEAKRLARMQRNRENAALSRKRRKEEALALGARCAQLAARNTVLTAQVARLVAENAALRQQVAVLLAPHRAAMVAAASSSDAATPAVSTAAATPAVSVGAAAPPDGSASTTQLALGLPPPTAAGVLQFMQLRGLPRVALPVFRPAQPAEGAAARLAPAPAAAPAPAPATQPPLQQPTAGRKRARNAAGVSTALLALLSMFMFAGPMGPAVDRLAGARHAALQLPAAAGAARHAARSLLALPPGGADPMADPRCPLEDLLAEEGPDGPTLRGLRDLGSSALALGPAPGVEPGALAQALPALAGQLLADAGLRAPSMCQAILEIDAASLPSPGLEEQREAVEQMLREEVARPGRQPRRALLPGPAGPGALALAGNASGGKVLQAEPELAGVATGGPDPESMVVSVLLPANMNVTAPEPAGGPGGPLAGGPAGPDRVYVVVLQPRRRYVAYACSLGASPVLA